MEDQKEPFSDGVMLRHQNLRLYSEAISFGSFSNATVKSKRKERKKEKLQ